LQNRLVKEWDTITSTPAVLAAFGYNTDGIRTSKTVAGVTTTYLIDPCNPTGYAQVLEELTGSLRTTYILGDDVIGQKIGSYVLYYLLYDGHGSTRQLADASGNIAASYGYDAYGVMLGGNPTPASPAATNLLYSGEYFDAGLKQYNLRARNYDPLNGRFNQLDPYAGNTSDPQSLHKYTYCHSDPVNGIDPSGMSFFSVLGTYIHGQIGKMYKAEHVGTINIGVSIPGWTSELLPDIMDFSMKEIAEIKPLSSYGIGTGVFQLAGYLATANYSKVPGAINKPWTPSSWVVGVREIPLPPEYATKYFAVTICNAYGVIFYKVFRIPTDSLTAVLLAATIARLADRLSGVSSQLKSLGRQGFENAEGNLAYLDQQAEMIFATTCGQRILITGAVASMLYLRYGIYARLSLSTLTQGF
jgi:RHS repeat-associated protein